MQRKYRAVQRESCCMITSKAVILFCVKLAKTFFTFCISLQYTTGVKRMFPEGLMR